MDPSIRHDLFSLPYQTDPATRGSCRIFSGSVNHIQSWPATQRGAAKRRANAVVREAGILPQLERNSALAVSQALRIAGVTSRYCVGVPAALRAKSHEFAIIGEKVTS
jgi:hypothetical protein